MDRLDELTLFVSSAELGSLAKAARKLGISAPTATRAINALEDRLGARLVERRPRGLRLTEAGNQFFEDARALLGSLREAEARVAGHQRTIEGVLSVTAPNLFGQRFVVPVIAELMERYSKLELRAWFDDQVVSLGDEGIDVAVRIAVLPDSELRGVSVGSVRPVLVAAPSYLERHGRLRHPRDLAQHRVLARAHRTIVEWGFRSGESELTVRVNPVLRVSSVQALHDALVLGAGVGRLLSYQAAEAFQRGQLLRLLPDFEPAPIPITILHREGPIASAKVRVFVEALRTSLTQRAAEFATNP